MAIDWREARSELEQKATWTVGEIFELVGRVTGKVMAAPPGSIYLLFTGPMDEAGTRAWDVSGPVVNSTTNVYDVGSSEVGRLIGGDVEIFNKRLQDAVAREVAGVGYADVPDAEKAAVDDKIRLYLLGIDSSGVRVDSGSLWDIACHSYCSEANGSFRVIAGAKFDDMSVLVTSELPAVLANPNVTDIDGVPRDQLQAEGYERARQIVNLNAVELAHYTQLSPITWGRGSNWMRHILRRQGRIPNYIGHGWRSFQHLATLTNWTRLRDGCGA